MPGTSAVIVLKEVTVMTTKKVKGFTLIELIVVIAIIGVLACILIPAMTSYIKKAQKRVDVENAREIGEAIELTTLLNDEAFASAYTERGSRADRTVTVDGETYRMRGIGRINGVAKGVNSNNEFIWSGGQTEHGPFLAALNESMGFTQEMNRPGHVNIHLKYNRTASGERMDGYGLYVRYDSRGKIDTSRPIEVWAIDTTGGWGNYPRLRLYPNPDPEYDVGSSD